MTERELFDIIDKGIDSFKKKEGHLKQITLDTKPHTCWLVFNWRQLRWEENGLSYLIAVCPKFSKQEEIESWVFYSAVYYDEGNKRYYLNQTAANEKSLESIANNIGELLALSFANIMKVKKEDIPFGDYLEPMP